MTDSAYWETLAAAYDGESTPPEELSEHLVFMGLTGELKPMTEGFRWHSADAVSFQVEQLIAAASPGEGHAADMAAMYRRARHLSTGGQPIPRAITAELVRMAVAELMAGTHPSEGAYGTPGRRQIERRLDPEPQMSDPDANKAAQQRNEVRETAKRLLDVVQAKTTQRVGAGSRAEASLPRIARVGRGFLDHIFGFQATRISNECRRFMDGGPTGANLDLLVTRSGILDALRAWSQAYGAATPDSARLKALLDNVRTSAGFVDAGLRSTFAMGSHALGLASVLDATVAEVAYEATELIRNRARNNLTQLDAVATLVEETTIRTKERVAAQLARDNAGLGRYVERTGRRYSTMAWYGDLKSAADTWSTLGDSYDRHVLGKATAAFAQSAADIAGTIKALPPEQAAVAEGILDALSSAVLDRVERIRAVDPPSRPRSFPKS